MLAICVKLLNKDRSAEWLSANRLVPTPINLSIRLTKIQITETKSNKLVAYMLETIFYKQNAFATAGYIWWCKN
jgi:hypothetical protein